jgi:putative thioredoxin
MDVTDATFETAVLDRSQQVPVVVDLWAPWCGPCRTLGPIIEGVIAATKGQVDLVKVNVDENPQVSSAFKVQSIPAVYAVKDRRVVDGFIGAQGEPFVTDFVKRLVPTAEETEVDRLLAVGDEASLRKALELEPDNERAIVTLADLLVDREETDEALALLERIPETPETRRVAALARVGSAAGDDGDIERRLDGLLERVKEDEAARQEFIDLLEVLGPDDPRTRTYRKALTARLY